MLYNGLSLMEHTEQVMSLSEILIRFGVNYAIDKSFIIVATFSGQQYFAMADKIEDLMSRVAPRFGDDSFKGHIYRVQRGSAVPVSCNGEFNVNNW